jgi:hypothetical protein
MNEARKKFHDVECGIPAESFQSTRLFKHLDGKTADVLTPLRLIVEPLRMAGSVEKLRELMANPNPDGNIFDFDLNHEEDEAMEMKQFKIFWTIKGFLKKNHLRDAFSLVDFNDHINPIVRKLFPTEDDYKFLYDFTIRFDSIRSYNMYPLGVFKMKAGGIPLFGTFFNHSCDPNVARVPIFDNKTAFVVMKPIKKGEQLFISYNSSFTSLLSIYNEPSTEKRRQELQRFGFKCSCFACVNKWSLEKIQNLPRFDRNFVAPPGTEFPKKFKDLVKEFKKNCAYIKKNFKRFPSFELYMVSNRNFNLLVILSAVCTWPTFKYAA